MLIISSLLFFIYASNDKNIAKAFAPIVNEHQSHNFKSATWNYHSCRGNLLRTKSSIFVGKNCFALYSSTFETNEINEENITPRNTQEPPSSSWKQKREEKIWILDKGENHAVVYKPPSVICHHSEWSGSKAKAQRDEEPTPMLQRVRDGLHLDDMKDTGFDGQNITETRRVNLVHRLDRGASGCLLFAYAKEQNNIDSTQTQQYDDGENGDSNNNEYSPTAALQTAMYNANKTYVALVRGAGILRERDFKKEGWFRVDRPIKDESGQLHNATTYFNFVAGVESPDKNSTDPRASLVLARPQSGRWHQVRKHLNGLSHPILGDTSHGCSKTNKQWRNLRQMPYQRTFLHLARLQLPQTSYTTKGIDVSCPLPPDFMKMLTSHLPSVLEESRPVLEREGIEVPTSEMLNSEDFFGGTSVTDQTDLPPLQKRHEEKIQRQTNMVLNNGEGPDAAVKLLKTGVNYVVAYKLPGIVCHHSTWTNSNLNDALEKEPTPMLQRVRDSINVSYMKHLNTIDTDTKVSQYNFCRVNLIHRLDRSASGCLLFAIPPKEEVIANHKNRLSEEEMKERLRQSTSSLIQALGSPNATKTYIALVHGSGELDGEDLRQRGWFSISSRLTDEHDKLNKANATTNFLFLASSSKYQDPNLRATLVLARPQTGQYHQIRKQLRYVLRHPIIGDSSHGHSRTNREWKNKFPLPKQRTCLHLSQIHVPSTDMTEEINVNCPLSMAEDMMSLLKSYDPDLLEEANKMINYWNDERNIQLMNYNNVTIKKL